MDLENTVLSEIQSEKDKYYMISTYMWNIKKLNLQKIENKIVVVREWG